MCASFEERELAKYTGDWKLGVWNASTHAVSDEEVGVTEEPQRGR